MKKLIYLSVALVFTICALHFFGVRTVAAQEQYKIVYGGASPVDTTFSKSQVIFKETVEKLSKGRIKVDLFFAGQLGKYTEQLEAVKLGTQTMYHGTSSYVVSYAPKLGVLNLPFLFKSRDQVFKLMDGPLGEELNTEMGKAGVIAFDVLDFGSRNISNSVRPIYTPEDLKGIKIRIMPNEVHLKTFRELGATPTPMDGSEVYSALKQGVIDAQENPLAVILRWKFYEAAKYISLTGHFYDMMQVWMNKPFYDKLPKDLQEVVRTGYREAAQYQRKAQFEDDEYARKKLEELGLKFNSLTDQQRALFRDKTRPVYDWLAEKIGKDIVTKWVDATK